ncbi:MAG: hypothetical protein IJR29_01430 [Butyrivibrio sp.]|nr:hypothetical protein [Butyrivibrio sp.]
MATDDKNTVSNLIVGGYHFISQEDAAKAQTDISKIKMLRTRVKADKPAEIKMLYEKAIENKIFRTPIGWGYLMDLKRKLIAGGYKEEDIIPIPVDISFTRHSAIENINVKQRIKPEKKEEKINYFKIISLALNVVLAILVVLMFVIASTSDNDNIINYKSNITNRYASWEQDLKEREKTVRQAEKKLGIEDTSSYYDGTE